jgi:transposase
LYYPIIQGKIKKSGVANKLASIIKKIKAKKAYYYAVESKRVDGKPRIVWQKYLGTLDDIIRKCTSHSSDVLEVDIFTAGGVAAMLRIAQKLSLIEIIDKEVPKRDQGASVGEYIVLAALNRILDPCSKLQMPEWYEKTVLNRLWKYSSDTFTSQMFWNHMDMIDDTNIDTIQEVIADKLIKDFKINPYGLLYDTTNFFTYVATGNKRNTIAQRGKNKAKRNDLRQVGLALLISKDFQIPLFHKVYQGDKPDRGIFVKLADELVQWQDKRFGNKNETTLVFDKGNISEDAMDRLIIGGKHYVCAVPKTTDNELYSTNVDEMKNAPGLPGTRYYTKLIEIWNKEHKAVVSYSDSFFASEMVDLMDRLRKIEEKLHDLDLWLKQGPQRPHDKRHYLKSNVKKRIDTIISNQKDKEVIEIVIKEIDGMCRLEYRISQNKLNHMMKYDLGRTLILSTRLDWSEEQIISSYRSQQGIENVFRHMKNKDYLHWQPEFHWTDNKIKVHGLYCVLAMLLASLAHREVVQKGLNLSLIEMLDDLNNIKEVALIEKHPTKKSKKNQLTMSRLSPSQKKLTEILEIPMVLAG